MNITPESSQPVDNRPWSERNGFSHWALALIWIIVAFVGFQMVAGIVAVILIIVDMGDALTAEKVTDALTENLDLLFIGNRTDSVSGFGHLVFCQVTRFKKGATTIFAFFPKCENALHVGCNSYTCCSHTANRLVSWLVECHDPCTGHVQ